MEQASYFIFLKSQFFNMNEKTDKETTEQEIYEASPTVLCI